MLRFLLFFVLTQTFLFSCTLCTLYTPETRVGVEVHTHEERITQIDFNWEFSDVFSEQLISIYDSNLDETLSGKELEIVEQALIDYIKPKNFLTHISYGNIVDEKNSDTFEVISYEVYMKGVMIHFKYTLKVNYPILNNHSLYVFVNDDEKYFLLQMDTNQQHFHHKSSVNPIVTKQATLFSLSSSAVLPKLKEESKETVEQEKPEQTYLEYFTATVKHNLQKVKEGDMFALLSLMLISFIYGVVHAIGPGHGKALTFAYFSAYKSSYFKAFVISLSTAFVHIVGAVVLVMVAYFILNTFLNNFVNDTLFWLTNISAVMIMLLAGYIFVLKVKKSSCSCHSCASHTSGENKKRDLYFVLTAGLIPCAGTVILFIYAFILKTYFAVVLAAVFISLGMGVVIFASSFLGVSLQKLGNQSHKITRILEIGSPVVMFILGVMLLLSTLV